MLGKFFSGVTSRALQSLNIGGSLRSWALQILNIAGSITLLGTIFTFTQMNLPQAIFYFSLSSLRQALLLTIPMDAFLHRHPLFAVLHALCFLSYCKHGYDQFEVHTC